MTPHSIARSEDPTLFRSVDHMPTQIERAGELLAGAVAEGRVTLREAQGERLPFDDATFDSEIGRPDALPICRPHADADRTGRRAAGRCRRRGPRDAARSSGRAFAVR